MNSTLLPDSINESSIIEASKLDEPLFRTMVSILSSTREILNLKLSLILETIDDVDSNSEFQKLSSEWRYIDRLFNIATSIKSL